ncbi:ABC-three component system middle component 6 [Roseiterribacter gracilis]|uniref:Uncharacterized protein n=1 Tax=Roseiterribacter gracilis TaxID=2812848 RepID=A0A8S8XGT7_9PROT|nr:hypothetical protein TMPK1_34580 [Rhodospirillales bacterium TMPK1]
MTVLPTKYVPIGYSILGLSALLLTMLEPADTVVSLWDRVRNDERIRTFDRFATALTLLFAGGIITMDRGVFRKAHKPSAES